MCHGLQLPSWRPQPALSAAPRPAAPVQRPPGWRSVPVAADIAGCCGSVRGGHQPSGHRPCGHRPCGHRPRFRKQQPDSHDVGGVRFRSHPGHRGRCPAGRPVAAGLERTRGRRSGAAAAPRTLDLLVCAGQVVQVDAAGGYRLSGRAATGRGLPDTREPARPGTAAGRLAGGAAPRSSPPPWKPSGGNEYARQVGRYWQGQGF
jgi:hypothetical protein